MAKDDLIERLRSNGLLLEKQKYEFLHTGSFALNKIISGSYNKGIPMGAITQFHGESSTAKTVFVTHILREAQKKGYYAGLADSENAFSPDFATSLGLDTEKLIYNSKETVEDCFAFIEDIIVQIREKDKTTPIVMGYDSIAVSPTRAELEDNKDYATSPILGAQRAKVVGDCLRRINTKLRVNNAALVIVNQIRNKIGVLYGSPDTMAAGGKSLEYYLAVNLKTISSKTKDLIKDSEDNVIGITGKIKNTKNKISMPFRECEFKLLFDKGLDPYYGILEQLVGDNKISRAGAWYTIEGTNAKLYKKDFYEQLDSQTPELAPIIKFLEINSTN